MMKKRVLVVDDLPDWRNTITNLLESDSIEVTSVASRSEAEDSIKQNPPDLVICDMRLYERDENNEEGIDLARWIKSHHPEIRVIIITAYSTEERIEKSLRPETNGKTIAFDFIKKQSDTKWYSELINRVHTALKCSLVITVDDDLNISTELKGAVSETRKSVKLTDSEKDMLRFIRRAKNIGVIAFSRDAAVRKLWKSEAKDLGESFYEKFFESPKVNIAQVLSTARGVVQNNRDRLKIIFKTSVKLLGLPFEFIHEHREYMAFCHPICRSLIEAPTLFKRKSFPEFINDLRKSKQPLRILIICSDSDDRSPLPGVYQETERLKEELKAHLNQINIKSDITYLTAEEATLTRVCEELSRGKYHMVHYSGHGSHDTAHPDQSALFFRKEAKQRIPIPLTAQQLNQMNLQSSPLQFVYLSCCYGSESSGVEKLVDDDFLGIADGLIQAGVPNVLGYRWSVDDEGAVILSLAFYKSLFGEANFDLAAALLKARNKTAFDFSRENATWLSPVLILQADYH